jgi:exonuclease SbcD
MRFLHTGDWHLGKALRHHRRDDEFQAVLQEVLDIARLERVDCLLVAGDLFDSAVPPPEAERLAFEFFRELAGARIPAVIIGGNHDHPRRLNAFGRVLELVGIHVLGEPVPPEQGGVLALSSRDGSQQALIALFPWLSERRVRTWEGLVRGEGLAEYAQAVGDLLAGLARSFRPDTVNLLVAHLLVDGALVGGEAAGERPLHLGQVYALPPQRLPLADYIALGHVHRHQQVRNARTRAFYAGSLLQLDFGEEGQQKCVLLVEVEPGRGVTHLEAIALGKVRQLRTVGLPDRPLSLAELVRLREAPDLRDAYLRIFVRVEGPFPGLAQQVREALPNAVEVVPVYPQRPQAPRRQLSGLTPAQLFSLYHRETFGAEAEPGLLALFQQLWDEVVHEAP